MVGRRDIQFSYCWGWQGVIVPFPVIHQMSMLRSARECQSNHEQIGQLSQLDASTSHPVEHARCDLLTVMNGLYRASFPDTICCNSGTM